MNAYQTAIDSLLVKVAAAEDSMEAARLAEVAINLANAAAIMEKISKDTTGKDTTSGEADNGSTGG